jgi:hypothetical protein
MSNFDWYEETGGIDNDPSRGNQPPEKVTEQPPKWKEKVHKTTIKREKFKQKQELYESDYDDIDDEARTVAYEEYYESVPRNTIFQPGKRTKKGGTTSGYEERSSVCDRKRESSGVGYAYYLAKEFGIPKSQVDISVSLGLCDQSKPGTWAAWVGTEIALSSFSFRNAGIDLSVIPVRLYSGKANLQVVMPAKVADEPGFIYGVASRPTSAWMSNVLSCLLYGMVPNELLFQVLELTSHSHRGYRFDVLGYVGLIRFDVSMLRFVALYNLFMSQRCMSKRVAAVIDKIERLWDEASKAFCKASKADWTNHDLQALYERGQATAVALNVKLADSGLLNLDAVNALDGSINPFFTDEQIDQEKGWRVMRRILNDPNLVPDQLQIAERSELGVKPLSPLELARWSGLTTKGIKVNTRVGTRVVPRSKGTHYCALDKYLPVFVTLDEGSADRSSQ